MEQEILNAIKHVKKLSKKQSTFENLIEETQLQDEWYEGTDKDITETCDIATKFKLFKEFQVSVEKKLLELEAAIVSGCNEQFAPENNISGNWQDNQ